MLGVTACPQALAQVDANDSQRVGNLQFGNSLDPTGWDPFIVQDPLGISWRHPGPLRTSSGVLYPYHYELPESDQGDDKDGEADWARFGLVQFRYLSTRGDVDNAFFRRYADWGGADQFWAWRPFPQRIAKPGTSWSSAPSRISHDDECFRLRAGRYGTNRFEFFHRATSHTLSTTAYPLWEGVGTTRLTTVPPGIVTGSSRATVRAAMEERPRQTLATARRRREIQHQPATPSAPRTPPALNPISHPATQLRNTISIGHGRPQFVVSTTTS